MQICTDFDVSLEGVLSNIEQTLESGNMSLSDVLATPLGQRSFPSVSKNVKLGDKLRDNINKQSFRQNSHCVTVAFHPREWCQTRNGVIYSIGIKPRAFSSIYNTV